MEQGFQTKSDREIVTQGSAKTIPRPSPSHADMEQLRSWVGRTEERTETICPAPVADLAATLDRGEAPGMEEPLPPLWHWLFFHPATRQSDLGEDGHTGRGGFLPPMPLPRRMWAGGRLHFDGPLPIGQPATRTSTILAIDLKHGKTGPLLFVTVGHRIGNSDGAVLIREEQDFVFREYADPNAPAAKPLQAPDDPEWTREVLPSTSMLFRYSALTFNGHRIHYDRPYAMDVEGYPGLVVHGPLLATLLLELLQNAMPEARIATFVYRAVSPLFDTAPVVVCGRRNSGSGDISLWAQTREGRLAMSATATLMPEEN